MRKVKGTLHWVSVPTALEAEVRLYDRLFNDEMPDGHRDHRLGYFCVDPDSTPEHMVFNRTVGLKDSWAKEVKKQS